MEILSPAGNIVHIDVAISEKANAVYGGLKKWNARNNAVNFSIEEYNEILDRLHINNIRFYLTLNTLMLNNEIKDIISLFKSGKIKLPDAFIVADIGLILRLKKEFNNVEIHASTQFGAHNIDDLKFLEKIGIKRAILARELTLAEITKLKQNTKLELEIFIWGSQCLSFSGLCFFGTFINGGSGNRGKCSIICRDTYEVNSEKGTFLYVPDMNCINLTKNLQDIDSLKIEGRRRTKEELAKVINEIRNKKTIDEQKGYLYGSNIEQSRMYEKINHRIKPICPMKKFKEIDNNDIFIEFADGIPKRFVKDLKERENTNIKYVYSEYKNSYKIEKNNIFFVFDIKDGVITQIDYTNYKGEFKSFYIDNYKDLEQIKIDEYVHKVENLSNIINVYKVKYIRNIENKYYISNKMLRNILNYVENNNKKGKEIEYNNKLKFDMIYLETDNVEVIDRFINDQFVKIIYNIENIEEIEKIVKKYNNKIIYKLPLFNWKSKDYIEKYKILEDKEIMFTRLSQLEIFDNIRVKRKYVDYSIYIWNSETLKLLKKYQVEEFTASPELNFVQNNEILKNEMTQYILCGKLPLVYTRNCFKEVFKCINCNKDRDKIKRIRNVSKDLDFEIICKKDYRMVFFNKPILNDYSRFDINDKIKFRYVTYTQNIEEIEKTVKMLKLENYFDNMKKTEEWKESYQNNLIITRA